MWKDGTYSLNEHLSRVWCGEVAAYPIANSALLSIKYNVTTSVWTSCLIDDVAEGCNLGYSSEYL